MRLDLLYPRPMGELLSGLSWGDVPAWISSVGGLGALGAASFAAWKTHELFEIESGRDEAARERDERAQADLVAAWLDRLKVGQRTTPLWHLVIANGSKVPVYAVRVIVIAGPTIDDGGNLIRRRFPVLQPGEEKSLIKEGLPEVITAALPVREGARLRVIMATEDSLVTAACEVWITFRDASGVHWTRTDEGILTRGVSGPFATEPEEGVSLSPRKPLEQ